MKKKITLVFIIIIIVIFITKGNNLKPEQKISSQPASISQPSQISEKDPPQIVSTIPNPLSESVIANVSKIEITFNRPLENEGEFKVRIEPKIEFKVSVSNERKTGVITFQKPLELGMSYTLFIGPDTKFSGLGNWGESKEFHFRTIRYRGL